MIAAAHTLARKTFRVSRLAEFASVTELIRQTGQPVANWPQVIAKELTDNGIDAAENAGTTPEIEIVVRDNAITVADCGPGIAPGTVTSLIDYSAKTSSNAAYVSPTRGQQGNALQSILPMGFALAQGHGEVSDAAVTIESQGVAHHIGFSVDPVRQTPVVSRVKERSTVKNGARITVRWPEQASSLIADAKDGFLSLASTYILLNPHLTLGANWCVASLGRHGGSTGNYRYEATDPGWKKWRPSQPTSAHWYDDERLKRLMAAMIADAADRRVACPSVRDFIGQFRGLSGTAKQNEICAALGVAEREALADFYQRRGAAAASALLKAMRLCSQPVKPRDLGVIGGEHLQARFVADWADPKTFAYKCAAFEHGGLPYVIEVAFACRSYMGETEGLSPSVVEGFNFSPAVGGSPFNLEEHLASALIEEDDPVVVFAHLTAPKLDFLDKGKARIDLPPAVADKIMGLVTAVTAKWTKQKRAEMRDSEAYWRRQDAMARRDTVNIKEAAYEVMVASYTTASADGAGGALPVKPRQIMYVARPHILKMTGRQTFDDGYFTQELLVYFMRDNPALTVDWDIIWDDRGHFAEPHTGLEIGLGTLPVRDYIKGFHEPEINSASIADAHVSTSGPAGRYHAVLFIEKEGFEPIFQAAGIYERYDLAPMSTKGMSTTAGRTLVEELCGRLGLPLFILHDFDKDGFSIKETLISDTERYEFKHELKNVVELGLRLDNVVELRLQSEPVAFKKNDDVDVLAQRLRTNGASGAEIDFLLSPAPGHETGGQRVELNALSSGQLVALVEAGLVAHGVTKVVPSPETLGETYAAFKRGALARQALEAELAQLNAEPVDIPVDLDDRVRAYLAERPDETWDAAIRAGVEEDEINARKGDRS